jgi:hypothetical protein
VTAGPPDEAALRRGDFRGGVPVVLCDGREWTFPLPLMRDFYPIPAGDGSFRLVPGSDLGASYDALCDAFVDAQTKGEEYTTLAALAYELLRRNYDLEPKHLGHLLRMKRDDDPDYELNMDMWGDIAAIVLGRDPRKKPTGDGSAPPPSPEGS